MFQHTAARRRLLSGLLVFCIICERFNTQPPEGGCYRARLVRRFLGKFQHTAARRRLLLAVINTAQQILVSTHSRPKAAANYNQFERLQLTVSTHSRPKAAARNGCGLRFKTAAGFNTQPPEGGCIRRKGWCPVMACFNTQPPEGGCILPFQKSRESHLFQHTAARRRLQWWGDFVEERARVSTHSRPKAAADLPNGEMTVVRGFNTQPPEGGC